MTATDRIGVLPRIGYGTWQRNGDEARACTSAALEAGYRHIDTAEGYGNEESVGTAIKESGLARDALFVTTKVKPEHLGPGQVRPAAEASLERLGLERVDLLLVHWPSVGDEYAIEDYLGQFAAVKEAGLTTHIGVSNFTKRHMDRAVEILGAENIATNQVEIHPLMQNRPIVEHCRALGIPNTAYCPLARGEVMGNAVMEQIAGAHDATVAQVTLAFLLAEGHVVIPTSSKPEHIAANLRALDLSLTEAEMEDIRGLDEGRRLVSGSWAPEFD
ncbi:aldo/keto reductase [Pseudoroseicyclus tamaricis]|uniref:Aldo/keto reductase n=1 Tax=Pseudoroseicyclus tamaricis TaxID=2705421 RepID=A0A6B2JVT2_9RHOB|nr:aldo/keto reductase [Pseudoroseicyclus tamaricis]NDV02388.1 aldo/keto reductase [Pseudoroseicyclus tamaricis]